MVLPKSLFAQNTVHNFFESGKEIHQKYLTYGHASAGAWDKPIWDLHEDIALGVNCVHGKYDKAMPFDQIADSAMPIYYMKEINRAARHRKWYKLVHDEEEWWKKKQAQHPQNIVVVGENGSVEKALVVDDVKKDEEGDDDDDWDDDGYDDDSEPHPHVYKWEDLKKRYLEDHGKKRNFHSPLPLIRHDWFTIICVGRDLLLWASQSSD